MFNFSIQFKYLNYLLLSIILIVGVAHAKLPLQVDLADATKYVTKNIKGKILSAKTTKENGLKVHRVQVLAPNGRVKIYQFNSVYSNKKHHRDNNRMTNSDINRSSLQNRQRSKKSSSMQRFNNHNIQTSSNRNTTIKSQIHQSKGANKEK